MSVQDMTNWLDNVTGYATGLLGWANAHKSGILLIATVVGVWIAVAHGQMTVEQGIIATGGILGIGTQEHSKMVQARRLLAKMHGPDWQLARAVRTMKADVEITGKIPDHTDLNGNTFKDCTMTGTSTGKYYTPPDIIDTACGTGSLCADAAKKVYGDTTSCFTTPPITGTDAKGG